MARLLLWSRKRETTKSYKSMNRYQIENLLQTLAMSQGRYGRLLDEIYSAPEDEQDRFWDNMEAQNFGDDLDVILYLEG